VHAPSQRIDVVGWRGLVVLDDGLRGHSCDLEVLGVGGGLPGFRELLAEIVARVAGRSRCGARLEPVTPQEKGAERAAGRTSENRELSSHFRHSFTTIELRIAAASPLYSSHFLLRPAPSVPERREQAKPLDRGKEVRER
jgi:hypothetical protein